MKSNTQMYKETKHSVAAQLHVNKIKNQTKEGRSNLIAPSHKSVLAVLEKSHWHMHSELGQRCVTL